MTHVQRTLAVTIDMDFTMLKAQKKVLCYLLNKKTINQAERETIEGLLCLIDHIQDTAVDECGVNEQDVYSLTGEEGEITLEQAKEIVLEKEEDGTSGQDREAYTDTQDRRN